MRFHPGTPTYKEFYRRIAEARETYKHLSENELNEKLVEIRDAYIRELSGIK